MMAKQDRPAAGSVHALVRGARRVLFVQFIVALLAFVAIGGAALSLSEMRREQERLVENNKRLDEEITKNTKKLNDLKRQADAKLAAFEFDIAGHNALRRGDIPQAQSWFAQARAADPQDRVHRYYLASAIYESKAYAQVSSLFADAALKEDEPDLTADDYLLLAASACKRGDLAEAEEAIGQSVVKAALGDNPGYIATNDRVTSACSGASFAARLASSQAPNAAPQTDAYRIRLVFLHIGDAQPAVREDARRVREALRAAPERYSVPGIEYVAGGYPSGGRVRYYFGPQKKQAEAIALQVERAVRAIPGWENATFRADSIEGRYDGLPTDRVEVWLPRRAGTVRSQDLSEDNATRSSD